MLATFGETNSHIKVLNKLKILSELENHKDELYAYRVLCTLSSLWLKMQENLSLPESNRENIASVRMKLFLEYIHKHISLPLSVAELAGAEFMSEGRYREIFRKALGMSPVDYIISLRINTACGLLRSTSMPVHEIAESVGYKDAAYFCRIFLKRTGMSPSDYRSSQ